MKVKKNRKAMDDATVFLRATAPLRAVRVLRLSDEFRRAARIGTLLLLAVSALAWASWAVLLRAPAFRLDPEGASLQIEGLFVLQRSDVEPLFAEAFGQSLVRVDVAGRLEQVMEIPWVREARVARLWPNTIAVTIEEREPIAFLRLKGDGAVRLIDAEGKILSPLGSEARSLPVMAGIDEEMPLEGRVQRIRLFEEVVAAFESVDGVASGLSEIDVSDPANAIVLAQHNKQMVRLQMGDRHLRHRLGVFLDYIESWRSEFGPVEAVDLRFEKQVAVQPASKES